MMKRLSDMLPLEAGTLVKVEKPEDVMALVEMGCYLGERIEVAHTAAAGGPIAILSGGRTLALRRKAAEGLWLEVVGGSDD